VSIPDFQTLMLPVLRIAAEGEIRISDAVQRLSDQFSLSAEERSHLLPSGRQTTFANRVHWAKSYLGKAGLVELTKRAHFCITQDGSKVLASPPERIDIKYLNKFPSFQKFRDVENQDEKDEPELLPVSGSGINLTPDEMMRVAHRKIEGALAQELLDRIQGSPPDFFERLIVNLLLKMGFGGSVSDAGRALGGSGDGGVDGVIDQDALGLDRIYIQAKRYATGNNIGPGAIRDFFGSLDRHKASKGLFVTTSAFSSSAAETAQLLSKRIVLIDGEQLAKLMIRHDVGCSVEDTLHIKRIDEDFFE
jgi:restriction system protein